MGLPHSGSHLDISRTLICVWFTVHGESARALIGPRASAEFLKISDRCPSQVESAHDASLQRGVWGERDCGMMEWSIKQRKISTLLSLAEHDAFKSSSSSTGVGYRFCGRCLSVVTCSQVRVADEMNAWPYGTQSEYLMGGTTTWVVLNEGSRNRRRIAPIGISKSWTPIRSSNQLALGKVKSGF